MAELEGIIARMRASEFRSQATISSQASRADTTTSRVTQLEQQASHAWQPMHACMHACRLMEAQCCSDPCIWPSSAGADCVAPSHITAARIMLDAQTLH